jgi:hypothetical protein
VISTGHHIFHIISVIGDGPVPNPQGTAGQCIPAGGDPHWFEAHGSVVYGIGRSRVRLTFWDPRPSGTLSWCYNLISLVFFCSRGCGPTPCWTVNVPCNTLSVIIVSYCLLSGKLNSINLKREIIWGKPLERRRQESRERTTRGAPAESGRLWAEEERCTIKIDHGDETGPEQMPSDDAGFAAQHRVRSLRVGACRCAA